jgi:rhamnose utilization protein RhaD (predicted bifunctional aldolase and dehydrogenase)
MDKQGIQELIQISHYAAADVAYIQGGGGNTSVKLDDTRMAVNRYGRKRRLCGG